MILIARNNKKTSLFIIIKITFPKSKLKALFTIGGVHCVFGNV